MITYEYFAYYPKPRGVIILLPPSGRGGGDISLYHPPVWRPCLYNIIIYNGKVKIKLNNFDSVDSDRKLNLKYIKTLEYF